MRQKTRGIIIMLLCASLTLTGCSNTTGSQKKEVKKEAADKEQTVKLTLWGGAEDQKMLQSMVDDFKKEHASEASFDIKLAVESETTCKETLLGDVEKGCGAGESGQTISRGRWRLHLLMIAFLPIL